MKESITSVCGRMIKAIAVLMAVTTVFMSVGLSAGAFTVNVNGKEYTFASHAPTKGDFNVLVIRAGFMDYPVDGENYPADSEETLLSFFDGLEDSVNAYYDRASYGQLHLSCDEVFTYNVQSTREESGMSMALEEALNALESQIDFEKYDSDNDGYLDFVALDFAGPLTGWGGDWWPCVTSAQFGSVGGKKVDLFTGIKGSAAIFCHEFGHILGAPDYYSYDGSNTEVIMTYDMMSNNVGDHDGFSKWYYGWLGENDVAYVDKNTGDQTVRLAPIETPLGDGKKIAVIAPETDSKLGFMQEYFLVEYDSGAGNNSDVFEEYLFEPGFRIFHVRGEAGLDEENADAGFINDNNQLRYNLIHNVKGELCDPSAWQYEDNFYREGDELTPDGYPNTGMAVDEMYNGRFTGIRFSDFVTGDEPSFKVSFTDDESQNTDLGFTLTDAEFGAELSMTLTTDKPAVIRRVLSPQYKPYSPYLLSEDGEMLILEIEGDLSDPHAYTLTYKQPVPAVKPMSRYTLVLPEGLFRTGYNHEVPEYRTTLTTPRFLALTPISEIPVEADYKCHSNFFALTESTYGELVIPYTDSRLCALIEYNLNGEEISRTEFELPPYNTTDNKLNDRLYNCQVYHLNDDNLALVMPLYDCVSFIKFNRKGELLSKVYTVSYDLTKDYTTDLFYIDYDRYKNGLCKLFADSNYTSYGHLIIDFESEPKFIESNYSHNYFNIGSDVYAVMNYTRGDRGLELYDHNDKLIKKLPFSASPLCVMQKGDSILAVRTEYNEDRDTFIYADTYSMNGELIESKEITSAASNITFNSCWQRSRATDAGYFIENISENGLEDPNMIMAFDRDWNYIGRLDINYAYRYDFVGNCGITQDSLYRDGKSYRAVLRFSIGDFEIVPKVRLLGDADLNGVTDTADATAIQRHDVKMSALGDIAQKLADVDRDGEVNIIDAAWVQRYAVRMKAPEGIGEPVQNDNV